MRIRDIAAFLGADVEGNDAIDIVRVAKIEEAVEGDITFIANPKYVHHLGSTRASAVLVSKDIVCPRAGLTLLRVPDPYMSFLKILQKLHPPQEYLPEGIHETAVLAPSATVGSGVRIGAHAVVGERCAIGANAMIGHGVVLGNDVVVGADSLLYSSVTVLEGCRIGDRVVIHSGTTIGSDGFGFAPKPDGSYEKIPQRGIVVIEDDVEIGANCAVDRATLGETRIRKGAKLDNLIQVAHNVVIGEHTVIAAQAGISGSTKVGNRCMIGGQAGFTGHLSIADNTKVAAQAGIHRSVEQSGEVLIGSPAYPYHEGLRILGGLPRLPELLATVRELKRAVEQLRRDLEGVKRKRRTARGRRSS